MTFRNPRNHPRPAGFIALFLLAVVVVTGPAAGAVDEAEGALIRDGSRVVFLGDSITHQCLYTQFIETYYFTRYPGMKIHFRNAGVSGDKASEALIRFEEDVASFKPDVVFVLLGMNDAAYQKFDVAIFENYRKRMNALLGKISGIGATAIIMGPTPFDSHQSELEPPAWVAPTAEHQKELTDHYDAALEAYRVWLKDRASELGLRYIDLAGPLKQATESKRKLDPDFTLIPDAVHPDGRGHVVMAAAILRQLGESDTVWSLALSKEQEDGDWKVSSDGCVVETVVATEDGLKFTFQATALPWLFDPELEEGVQLANAYQMGREKLVVKGLPEGRYTLFIDRKEVGEHEAGEWAAGIELQSNSKTPQHQRGLLVTRENLLRNMNVVKPVRDLWRGKRGGKITADEFDEAIASAKEAMDGYIRNIDLMRQPKTQIFEIRASD